MAAEKTVATGAVHVIEKGAEKELKGWIQKSLYKKLSSVNPELLKEAEELLQKGLAERAQGADGIKWLKGKGIDGYMYELKFTGKFKKL